MAASVVAVTRISASLHRGVVGAEATVDGFLLGVTDGAGVAGGRLAEGDGEGSGVGDPEGAATGAEPPPRPPTNHSAPTTMSASTISTRTRRTQYTLGGCGPTGRITWLTGPTLPGRDPRYGLPAPPGAIQSHRAGRRSDTDRRCELRGDDNGRP